MSKKINAKDLRAAGRRSGYRSIQHMADEWKCSREAIYFAMENPSRFPRVFKKITGVMR